MISSEGAGLPGRPGGNVIEPANALLALELTLDDDNGVRVIARDEAPRTSDSGAI